MVCELSMISHTPPTPRRFLWSFYVIGFTRYCIYSGSFYAAIKRDGQALVSETSRPEVTSWEKRWKLDCC